MRISVSNLDLDVLVLRDFAPIFDAAAKTGFAIAREGDAQHGGDHGLCNAVLVAVPNSSFASRWLASYSSFGSSALDPWNGHSVAMPLRLAHAHPASVVVLDYDAFFWPDWDEEPLAQLLLERTDPLAVGTDGRGRFALHLWHHVAEPFVLSQWSPAYLSAVASSLNCILSRHLAAYETTGTDNYYVLEDLSFETDGFIDGKASGLHLMKTFGYLEHYAAHRAAEQARQCEMNAAATALVPRESRPKRASAAAAEEQAKRQLKILRRGERQDEPEDGSHLLPAHRQHIAAAE